MKMKKFKIISLAIIVLCYTTFYFYIFANNIYKIKKNNIRKLSYVQLNLDGPKSSDDVKIIAHRGVYHNDTENSIEAIKDSIEHNVGCAEIDVQETRDGVVILMHDRSLRRLTGINKTVNQLDYNQIEKLNIASPYLKRHKIIERIPTLDQVIKECNGRIKLIIEIKPYWRTIDLTNKVAAIIKNNNFEENCMVHSGSYKALLYLKSIQPSIKTGEIVYRPIKNLSMMDVDFYSVRGNIVNKKMIDQIHNADKKVYAWTIDNRYYMKKMIELKVDGIITDKPSLLMSDKSNIY